MSVRRSGWVGFLLWAWMSLSFAEAPESIPATFPADQQAALTKERQALLAEEKRLDTNLAKHNRICSSPSPYHTEKCSQDKLELYPQIDAYQKKVKEFNRRLSAIDQSPVKNSDPHE